MKTGNLEIEWSVGERNPFFFHFCWKIDAYSFCYLNSKMQQISRKKSKCDWIPCALCVLVLFLIYSLALLCHSPLFGFQFPCFVCASIWFWITSLLYHVLMLLLLCWYATPDWNMRAAAFFLSFFSIWAVCVRFSHAIQFKIYLNNLAFIWQRLTKTIRLVCLVRYYRYMYINVYMRIVVYYMRIFIYAFVNARNFVHAAFLLFP